MYPHICLQCGDSHLSFQAPLCKKCIKALPYVDVYKIENNALEKIFWGRHAVHHVSALLYFTKESIVQLLLFELKYKHNEKAGFFLGKLMGLQLKKSALYKNIDLLIPLPISAQKIKIRGYNQSQIICEGIQSVWPIEMKNGVVRTTTSLSRNIRLSQTHQGRLSRMGEEVPLPFELNPNTSSQLLHKSILIVDDVLTTGATLDAAILVIEGANPLSISVSTAAYTLP